MVSQITQRDGGWRYISAPWVSQTWWAKDEENNCHSKAVSNFCFSRWGYLRLPQGRNLSFKNHLSELFSYMDMNPNSFPEIKSWLKRRKITKTTTKTLGQKRTSVTQRPNGCFWKTVGRPRRGRVGFVFVFHVPLHCSWSPLV